MKPFERIMRFFDSLVDGRISTALREASAIIDDREPPGDAGKYRGLTKSARDLSPIQYQRMVEMAYYMWQRNPMAKRILQIPVDFCTGEGFAVECRILRRLADGMTEDTKRKDAQSVWSRFAEDPANNFYAAIPALFLDTLLNGELVLLQSVNENDGSCRYGYMDSKFIREVRMKSDGRTPRAIVVMNQNNVEEEIAVIAVDQTPESLTYGKRVGVAHYFRINNLLSHTRGHSEIMQLLDWMDALDQFMFNTLDGAAVRNSFFYDVTVKEADYKKLKAIRDELDLATPANSEVKVHNDKVEWSVKTPDLKAFDASEMVRLFKNFILAGIGYPEHWFADGGNTNLATASAMDLPVLRMLKAKQETLRNMVKEIALFVLDQATIYNRERLSLAPDEYFDVRVSMFDFDSKDAAIVGSGFVQIATALKVAQQEGWISDETSKKIISGFVERMGVEIDPNETIDAPDKTGEDDAIETYARAQDEK